MNATLETYSRIKHVCWCMMYGVWCMKYDVWCMMYDVWCMMYLCACLYENVQWPNMCEDTNRKRSHWNKPIQHTHTHTNLTAHHTHTHTHNNIHTHTRHTSHITHHTSHITHYTSHITHYTSHITHHTSHITHHTSHITHHTSHITHHTQPKPDANSRPFATIPVTSHHSCANTEYDHAVPFSICTCAVLASHPCHRHAFDTALYAKWNAWKNLSTFCFFFPVCLSLTLPLSLSLSLFLSLSFSLALSPSKSLCLSRSLSLAVSQCFLVCVLIWQGILKIVLNIVLFHQIVLKIARNYYI